MAEGIATNLMSSSSGNTFSSMGIQALVGSAADSQAVEVCREIDIDISNHIARQLDIQELLKAEMIFCMDLGHLQFVSAISPLIEEKCVLFMEYPTKKLFRREVWDPYKLPFEKFRKNRDMILKQVKLLVSTL